MCDRVQVGGVVYHDVTDRKWAEKAADNGVRGLIAVNSRAGGHPGNLDPRALLDDVAPTRAFPSSAREASAMPGPSGR